MRIKKKIKIENKKAIQHDVKDNLKVGEMSKERVGGSADAHGELGAKSDNEKGLQGGGEDRQHKPGRSGGSVGAMLSFRDKVK